MKDTSPRLHVVPLGGRVFHDLNLLHSQYLRNACRSAGLIWVNLHSRRGWNGLKSDDEVFTLFRIAGRVFSSRTEDMLAKERQTRGGCNCNLSMLWQGTSTKFEFASFDRSFFLVAAAVVVVVADCHPV
jgi:hypothetical protein